MKEKIIENLETLCITPGISGNEIHSGISHKIYQIVKDINENTMIDKYGNVISILKGGGKKVIIDAHLDEVGFLVSTKTNGKIKLVSIGDINIQKIDNSDAFVFDKDIKGKIFQDTSDLVFEALDKDLQESIMPGDIISFSRSFSQDGDIIKGTALDNRIGCACIIHLIEKLKEEKNDDLEIIFTFTSGEEKDSSNIHEIANEYNVDFGIIIDAAYAKPVRFGTDNMSIPELGEGCAIQYIGRNFVVNKAIIDILEKKASDNNIPFQKEIPLPDLGRTNFSKLQQIGKSGCVINIPVKKQHEQESESNMQDFDSACDLIEQAIKMFEAGEFNFLKK